MPENEIPLLKGRRILLGVTGSIAAFKAADLASKLAQTGAEVDCILTVSAERFVTALTFQSLTGRRAYVDADLWSDDGHILHVGLAQAAELLVIAPATADTIAKLVHGRADSLLTITSLAATCPSIVAPAMDAGMFEHPATQANLETLRERGVTIVGPVKGRMASGLIGIGRMSEPRDIVGSIRLVLGKDGPLAGRKIVVTAGGTQEPLDPVRVLANRSSGKQGFAMAQAALDRGAEVTLISAPSQEMPPTGAVRIDVQTAKEMSQAVLKAVAEADALIMAAAVADFRPRRVSERKIKRAGGVPEVPLEPTEDILAQIAQQRPEVVVGFAAESNDLIKHATSKLKSKGLDLIVANDITAEDAGFATDMNRVTLVSASGGSEELPLMTKSEVAEIVVERIEELLREKS
ncbi:MAG: bifunctional phosphopantothenoylcysteine decarboxylase/phosphopantothenate--cysteine ligase CoaBC [Chloroflexi bacterium]|nr:bifunctional phosphopantothenoylcysteine decarboxylase/phosphopantothenate--cysteine ligase CoaBC [Chloroflexota bacterium]